MAEDEKQQLIDIFYVNGELDEAKLDRYQGMSEFIYHFIVDLADDLESPPDLSEIDIFGSYLA